MNQRDESIWSPIITFVVVLIVGLVIAALRHR